MTRSNASRGPLDVFDFDEFDEDVPKQSARIMEKFRRPLESDRPPPVTKYTFLEQFKEKKPRRKSTVVVPVDSDSSVSVEMKRGRKDCIDVHSSSGSYQTRNARRKQNLSSREPATVVINEDDGDDNTVTSSLSASTSASAESKSSCEEPSMEFTGTSWRHNTVNKEVVISPESIVFGNIYSTEASLTFTPSSIKLAGSFKDNCTENFCFGWSVDDVIKVESQWCNDVETGVINVYFRREGAAAAFSKNGSTGNTLLKFTVYGSSWFQGQEAIKLLHPKYKAMWNVIYDIDSGSKEDGLLGTEDALLTENVHPEDTSELLVFPKDQPDAVSISERDVKLLQPDTFINDTIIDFYMKYLSTKIRSEERHRFYFFNSFFFRKLADLDKDSTNNSERNEAFQRVRKWTRNVNLFDKDFIFIPINFSLHWSLIVICHPGELARFKDAGWDKLSKVPCILHMDSMKGSHRGIKNLFQRYLLEEFRVWRRATTEDGAKEDGDLNVSKINFISLELPQQQNSSDCGLFLLHYVERFLLDAPIGFNPFNRACSTNFLNGDWFPPSEVSSKRANIQELIHKLVSADSENNKQADHSNQNLSTPLLDRNHLEIDPKVEVTCSSTELSGHQALSSNEPNYTASLPVAPSSAKWDGETLGLVVRNQVKQVTPELDDSSVKLSIVVRDQNQQVTPERADSDTKSWTMVNRDQNQQVTSKQDSSGPESWLAVAEQELQVTPAHPENLRDTAMFCSEVEEKVSDHIGSFSNPERRIVRGKIAEPLTSYRSKFMKSLKSTLSKGASKISGMTKRRKLSFNCSTASEKHDNLGDQQYVDVAQGFCCVESHSASIPELENCIVEDSDDEVKLGYTRSSPGLLDKNFFVDYVKDSDDEGDPDHTRSSSGLQGKNVYVDYVKDSELEDSTNHRDHDSLDSVRELTPIIYLEKDIVNVEDKFQHIIDLSIETDDDQEKQPVKRPRLTRNR